MPLVKARVSAELLAGFDAAAVAHGGRSARLRALMAADAGVGAGSLDLTVGGAVRLMVRLPEGCADPLGTEAARMGLSRSGWVAALARRRLEGRPSLTRSETLDLMAIQGDLRRIGVNINQIARALNTAVLEGRVVEAELRDLAQFRTEVRAHVAALGEAFAGNLAYWATP